MPDAELGFTLKAKGGAQAAADVRRTATEIKGAVADLNDKTNSANFGASGALAATTAFKGLGSQLSSVSPLLGRLGSAAPGIGLAATFFAAAKAGVAYDEVIDRLTVSFTTLLHSQEAATKHLKELQDFAARTPFEFEDVARASQRFLNMGVVAGDVVPILTAVGNAVAAAGGGSEQINRVSLAIAQMAAKGKVSAEEMNQLAEAGVGGWKLLEEQLGKSKGELIKMAEQGRISADTFVKAFRAAYEGGNGMQKQSETLTGALSTLKDTGKSLLGEVFRPMHAALRDVAVEMAKVATEGWNVERSWNAARRSFMDFVLSYAQRSQGNPQRVAEFFSPQPQQTTAPGRDIDTTGKRFLDDFKARREALAKELGKLDAGRDVLADLQADIRTFGDDSNVARVTEQFRKLREQLAATGETFSEEAVGQLAAWERESVKAAAQLDVLIKRQKEKEEADKKAKDEAKRQSEVTRSVTQDYKEAALRVQLYYENALQLEAALYKLAKGYETLTDANKQLVQAEVNRLFSAKQTEQRIQAAEELRRSLTEYIDRFQLPVYEAERTETQKVTAALGQFADAGGTADETLKKLAASALLYAQRMDDAAKAHKAWIEAMNVPVPENVPLPIPGIGGSGQTPSYGPQSGPYVNPEEFTKEFGEPPAPKFDMWKQSLNALKDVGKGVFGGLTQGFGAMVSALLLGEKGAAKSFASIAKSAIAAMAVQAAVSALFQLAEGLAWLFINPPKAAAHFQSAAVFGIVAGMAGAASALIPKGSDTGSAFGGSGGSAFGGGGFGSSSQDNGPTFREQPRNTVIEHVHILRVESNDSHIINVLTKDVRSNGPTRGLIIETAAA